MLVTIHSSNLDYAFQRRGNFGPFGCQLLAVATPRRIKLNLQASRREGDCGPLQQGVIDREITQIIVPCLYEILCQARVQHISIATTNVTDYVGGT